MTVRAAIFKSPGELRVGPFDIPPCGSWDVHQLKAEDQVAGVPDVHCGECWFCRKGFVHLCDNHQMIGTHCPGGFAEFIHLPREVLERGMIHPVPEGLSLDHVALSEPGASVIAAQETASVGFGDTALAIGDGPAASIQAQAILAVRNRSTVILFDGLPKTAPLATLDVNRSTMGRSESWGTFHIRTTPTRRRL